jgi:hypothetical protein
MVVGGAVPFVPQYLLIRRTSSAEGFSLYVCLTLLAANILRIFFWFGKRFETPLLLQSGIMIAMMFALIKLCVDVRTRSNGSLPTAEPTISYRRRFRDMNLDHFWHWHDFSSYIECALCYAIFCAIITFLFGNRWWFVEAEGLLAVLLEAALGLPQLLRNARKRSTRGMR